METVSNRRKGLQALHKALCEDYVCLAQTKEELAWRLDNGRQGEGDRLKTRYLIAKMTSSLRVMEGLVLLAQQALIRPERPSVAKMFGGELRALGKCCDAGGSRRKRCRRERDSTRCI